MESMTEKLENCKEDLKELKDDRDNHEGRIHSLEMSNSSILVEIKHLIESVNGLVSMLRWGFTAAFMLLAGFFVWYIQSL